MGANLSTNANGLLVGLERPSCFPGDAVQGVVCLNVLSPIHTTGVYLKLKGFERTHWTTRHSRQVAVQKSRLAGDTNGNVGMVYYTEYETEYYTVQHNGMNTFFRVQIPLGPAGVIPPGQHQFPFLCTLPSDLPPSFYYKAGDTSGEICYKIKGVVGVHGLLKPNLRHTQELHVATPLQACRVPQQQSTAQEIMMCGCFGSGHASANLVMDSAGYCTGEAMELSLRVQNASKKPFKTIKVKVMREVQLRGTDVCPKGGNSKVLVDTVASCAQQGWPAGQVDCERAITFPLPAHMEPSTSSGLITCHHWIQVKLEQGAFKTCLRLRLPLNIQAPLVGPQWQVVHLANWRPAHAGTPVIVQLPDAPPVPPHLLQPENQFWRRLAAAPPCMGEARSEPFAAAAGQPWGAPMSGAQSAPIPTTAPTAPTTPPPPRN